MTGGLTSWTTHATFSGSDGTGDHMTIISRLRPARKDVLVYLPWVLASAILAVGDCRQKSREEEGKGRG